MDLEQKAIDLLQERFADAVVDLSSTQPASQRFVVVSRDKVVEILRTLRDELEFDMLMDLTALDWLGKDRFLPSGERAERFEVVYQLYSLKHNAYFRLKTPVPESDPVVDTASDVWKAVPWAEREVWDMYGIAFRGHPDLRRILLPFGYEGHPLRKDYPLQGRGERQQFPRYEK